MKKIFTPKRIFFIVQFSFLAMAGLSGFHIGLKEWSAALFYGSFLVFNVLIILWESKLTVNEESVEKEDLIRAMQIYNRNWVQDPEGFEGIDETRKCAEDQVNYILNIVKYRIKKQEYVE